MSRQRKSWVVNGKPNFLVGASRDTYRTGTSESVILVVETGLLEAWVRTWKNDRAASFSPLIGFAQPHALSHHEVCYGCESGGEKCHRWEILLCVFLVSMRDGSYQSIALITGFTKTLFCIAKCTCVTLRHRDHFWAKPYLFILWTWSGLKHLVLTSNYSCKI